MRLNFSKLNRVCYLNQDALVVKLVSVELSYFWSYIFVDKANPSTNNTENVSSSNFESAYYIDVFNVDCCTSIAWESIQETTTVFYAIR